MPQFEVKCYRTAERTERTCEVLYLTVTSNNSDDAGLLAKTVAEKDLSAVWVNDVDAPDFAAIPVKSVILLGPIHHVMGSDRLLVSPGLAPYPVAGAQVTRPTDGQPAAERPALVAPPAHARGRPVDLPAYDEAAERRAAGIADLLTANATGEPVAAAPVGLEPADPKELQNDAPTAHGQVPPFVPWTPRGPDHLLNATQRDEIRKTIQDAYDREFPGERVKQEEVSRRAGSN